MGGLGSRVTIRAPKKEDKGKERERKDRKKRERRKKERKRYINMTNRAPFKHNQGRPGGAPMPRKKT